MDEDDDILKDVTLAIDLIIRATKNISHDYFIPSLRNVEPLYRERVYCYELYHQMRNEMDRTNFSAHYVINGELDKASTGIDMTLKPDFIFHVPGEYEHNLIAMEVKRAPQLKMVSLRKDISKLNKLMDDLSYKKGIMLIFGGMNVLTRSFIEGNRSSRVLFLHHLSPSGPAATEPENLIP